ncbi:MAG: hypothetical protein H6Q17_1519 [Bacteroidetes bacterium]|jgi:hypothetical protein|nr:hypothetical protein [Bacteroidota bacterium]
MLYAGDLVSNRCECEFEIVKNIQLQDIHNET